MAYTAFFRGEAGTLTGAKPMSDSSNERLNNGEFHLKEINRCREVFMETDSESEREFHAHLALDAFGHLLRETCGWALQ